MTPAAEHPRRKRGSTRLPAYDHPHRSITIPVHRPYCPACGSMDVKRKDQRNDDCTSVTTTKTFDCRACGWRFLVIEEHE